VYVSVEDEIAAVDNGLRTFFNVNRREDLATAEKMIANERP
jgi:molybdopterin-guanine dinucleotide biosynthesis protein A